MFAFETHLGNSWRPCNKKVILEKHLLGKISWENIDNGACFSVKLPLPEKESL